jgi:uncharacterized protein YkwD
MLIATATVVAGLALVVAEGVQALPETSLVVSAKQCPGSRSLTARRVERRAALLCLVNHAREAVGLPAIRGSRALQGVASAKARDVATCSDFNHAACGRPPFAHVASSRLPYSFLGENLFYSERPVGTARDVFVAWLRSPPHRRLMFLRRFDHAGIAVVQLDRLLGSSDVELWVLELGQRA